MAKKDIPGSGTGVLEAVEKGLIIDALDNGEMVLPPDYERTVRKLAKTRGREGSAEEEEHMRVARERLGRLTQEDERRLREKGVIS